MAVVSKDEILAQIKILIGDNTSDEAVTLIENISDTFDSRPADNSEALNKRITELEDQLKENDKMWRDKYTSRFFSGNNIDDTTPPVGDDNVVDEDEEEKTKIEDLFSQD